jgi:signal transduction histidine kinase
MKQATKRSSIRRRIIVQFCLFSLGLSALFSAYNFLFLYIIEDVFIERTLTAEADYLSEGFASDGIWPTPRQTTMVLHHSLDTFPPEVKSVFIEEPFRKEFYGLEGRHYHLLKLPPQPAQPVNYLLGEVSEQLVVRPLRGPIITGLLVSALLLTFLACFIAWRLATRTIKPLSDLVRLVDGVSPENLPKSFAHHYPKDEIGALAETLEQSMQRINEFVEREQHFTRDASHELRTPIAIIKNAAELLEADNQLSESTRTLTQRISRATLQMEQTVNTLLSLAREQPNSVNPPVKLLGLVEKAIIEQAYLLQGKPVEVIVNVASATQVNLPVGIVQILLANLLGNAFAYTQAGEVTISYSDDQLCVTDTGPGIEDDIKDQVLDSLVKGSTSQGFGIGLSIVKRLCEHHQLNLTIESLAIERQPDGSEISGVRIKIGLGLAQAL